LSTQIRQSGGIDAIFVRIFDAVSAQQLQGGARIKTASEVRRYFAFLGIEI
jgi:hypothetical protein